MPEYDHLPIKDRLILWLLLGETGVSSETIAYALSGVKVQNLQKAHICYNVTPCMWDVPHDAADFRRCLRLLEYIPEWRKRLPEVAERFPSWKGIVEHWDELERLYEEGRTDADPTFRKFQDRLRELRNA